MNITGITLDGLDLMSGDYYFVLTGLFDFNKNITTNDLYIDGQSYNSSKVNEKALLLSGAIYTNDINKNLH